MLVAPVLAILAYFLTDHFVSEKPHAAKKGTSYRLIAKPNCRYESGKCELRNGEFLITLKTEPPENKKVVLKLDANFALEGVKIAIGQPPQASPTPQDMRTLEATKTQWQAIIDQPTSDESRLQLVVAANGSFYFADTATIFFNEVRPFKDD